MGTQIVNFLFKNCLMPMYKNMCPKTKSGLAIIANLYKGFTVNVGIKIKLNVIKAYPFYASQIR